MIRRRHAPTLAAGGALLTIALLVRALLFNAGSLVHDPEAAAARSPRPARDEFDARDHDADAPRLELPGALIPRAGQEIELRWNAGDSIRELEFLLSTDGGRTYRECTPPRLDPRLRKVRWRVPDGDAGALRLRIRYNRGGQEIEGAPIALARPNAPDLPDLPLALPLADGAASEPPSRDGHASGSTGEFWAADDRASPQARPIAAFIGLAPAPASGSRRAPRCFSTPFRREPAFLPLRI